MTPLPYRRWAEYWLDPQNDGYDPAANSRDCYTAALAAIRLRLVRDGDVFPREDEPVDLVVLRVL